MPGRHDQRGEARGSILRAAAAAIGVFHLNDCRPNCAAGHYKTHRARITLFKVRHCNGQRRYLDVKVQPKNLPLATWGSNCRGAQVVSP